jgi:hypothetical protein
MDKKTEGVEILVKDVLASKFSEPYNENIILKVFQEIEKTPELEKRYHSLSNDVGDGFSDDVINNWIGKYVKDQTRLNSLREVSADGKCSLITRYMKLRK